MCLAVDADEHLIKMPAPIRPVALVYPPLPDLGGKQRAKTVPPVPHGFMAEVDAALKQDIVGAITKAGDAGLRTALYQAATVMLNRAGPNWLKAWALRLAKLRGKKRATIALARRIGVVLHRMWRDGTEFRFTREEAMAIRTA